LAALDFTAYAETSIRDNHSLRESIEKGRNTGYFLNMSEYTSDVTGTGMPLMVDNRILGLSIAGSNDRMRGNYARFAKQLHMFARDIEITLNSAYIH